MTGDVLIFLLAGAISGGFIKGLAGTGTALFTLGFWLQVIPPLDAVAMVLIISIISGIQGMVMVWKTINWRRLMRFLLPALLAMPLGLYLIDLIEAGPLKIIVAVLLITYGGFFSFRKDLSLISKPTYILDGIIGFFAGVLGMLGGLSGAFPKRCYGIALFQRRLHTNSFNHTCAPRSNRFGWVRHRHHCFQAIK